MKLKMTVLRHYLNSALSEREERIQTGKLSREETLFFLVNCSLAPNLFLKKIFLKKSCFLLSEGIFVTSSCIYIFLLFWAANNAINMQVDGVKLASCFLLFSLLQVKLCPFPSELNFRKKWSPTMYQSFPRSLNIWLPFYSPRYYDSSQFY